MSWFGRGKPVAVPQGSTTLKGKTVDVTIPSGQTIDLQGLETWQVTWNARVSMGLGAEHSRIRPKGQLFTNRTDAYAFAEALKNAYLLVDNTIDIKYIEVERLER